MNDTAAIAGGVGRRTESGPSPTEIARRLAGKRIAVVSYPTLFQSPAGLAMKVRTTVRYLNRIGVDAKLANLVEESLNDFDLVHVFAALNANHRIVLAAKGFGKPVVVSPIAMPPLSRFDSVRAAFLTRIFRRLTAWHYDTSYAHTRAAVEAADHLIALGTEERNILVHSLKQPPDKVTIVPNGVGDAFFTATGDIFKSRHTITPPMVLHVGIIGEVKNQLGLVRALRDEDVRIVLIGPCSRTDRGYLDACLAEGAGKVTYLGEFAHGDELLMSAYAAADVLAVPSQFEGMSNSVLEALASGTPVVTTDKNSFDAKKDPTVYREVPYTDTRAIREAVMALLRGAPPAERCRGMVRHLSWENVAARVGGVYVNILGERA